MPRDEEKAREIIEELARESDNSQKITDIVYRPDYMDYQVVLDNTHHCEIREKLIDTIEGDKSGDVRREIKDLITNAIEFEDWEQPAEASSGGDDSDRMIIDDEDPL